MKYYYGLDVSTSRLGIAIFDEEKKLQYCDVLRFDKIKGKIDLEEKAQIFYDSFCSLLEKYPTENIAVEQPCMVFNKSSAQTISILQRFNGMVSYIVRQQTGKSPKMIEVRSARRSLGIKILTKKRKFLKEAEKKKYTKQQVIDYISENFDFEYEKTKSGNFAPGTDDRADACVVALAAFFS